MMEETTEMIYLVAKTRLYDAMTLLQNIYNPEDATLNKHLSKAMAALNDAEEHLHAKLSPDQNFAAT